MLHANARVRMILRSCVLSHFWLCPSGTRLRRLDACLRCSPFAPKTKVYVCLSYLPPPPRTRLNRLERPSLRISYCLGDQVTQDSSPRPRAPGPPSLPKLLNEQALERKLHRLLSGVLSAQAGRTHRQRFNCPLKLSQIRLGITLESRSTH